MKISLWTLLLALFTTISAHADSKFDLTQGLYQGHDLSPISLEMALQQIKPGGVVVVGELHGTQVMPLQHMQILETLRKNGLKVSLGMEFFEYPQQSFVDQYRRGHLSESEFLTRIKWGGFPFDSYRSQVLFPSAQEQVVALNAPRALTGRIAKQGIIGLTPAEKAQMPPDFTLGSGDYFERFKESVGGHLPDALAAQRYFEAQCTWDDTMAWQARVFAEQHPDQVLVIIVGEFHVQYGGGLPARLKARGFDQVMTFSQVNLKDLTEQEVQETLLPSPKYGDRADFIWTSEF